MLVLTRKQNQSIQVGDVIFTVLRAGPRAVSIGIEAPANVPIVRTEILGAPRETKTPAEAAA